MGCEPTRCARACVCVRAQLQAALAASTTFESKYNTSATECEALRARVHTLAERSDTASKELSESRKSAMETNDTLRRTQTHFDEQSAQCQELKVCMCALLHNLKGANSTMCTLLPIYEPAVG